MASSSVSCPLCDKKFPKFLINQHANKCLAEQQDNENSDQTQDLSQQKSPIKRKIDENPIKETQSCHGDFYDSAAAAWGSLKPQEAKKHKPNDSKTPTKSKKSPLQSPNKYKSGSVLKEEKSLTNVFKTTTPEGTSTSSSDFSMSTRETPTTNFHQFEDDNKQTPTTTTAAFNELINFKIPLAESMRPKCLSQFIGQKASLGNESFYRRILLTNSTLPPSIIFWGPAGSGKTTLAKMIAKHCKENSLTTFTLLSATSSGVNEVKKMAQVAKNNMKLYKLKTILFIDEIHRFNKLQQDSLLPYVEDGTFILFGATTENPSFHLNSALLSRVKVVVLEKHSVENITIIIKNTLEHLGIKCFSSRCELDKISPGDERPNLWMAEKAVSELAYMCDGDARVALHSLQVAIQNQLLKSKLEKNPSPMIIIDADSIKESLLKNCIGYDKNGEDHYNCVSALQKSIRGSDENAALYWLARMLEGGEDPRYVARRLVRTAAEDIGLADPLALTQAVSAYQACTLIGMPECDVILAQCAVYLARASKSIEVYSAYNTAKKYIHQQKGPLPPVPLHLRNAPTKLMKSLDYGKNYIYTPNDPSAKQTFLPDELLGVDFFN